MGLAGWFRFRQKQSSPAARAGALLRVTCSGADTGELLEAAARTLLAAAQASRAGVWLVSEDNPDQLEGPVVAAGLPATWQRLNAAAPDLGMLLASADPVVVDLRRVPEAALVEALRRMCTAAWIPLRLCEKKLGLALVAYRVPQNLAGITHLRGLADELALVVALRRAEGQAARAKAELEDVLESVPSGVLLLGASGRVRFANARFAQLLELSQGSNQALPAGLDTLDALAEALEGRLVRADASGPPLRHARSFTDDWRALDRRGNEPVWEDLELAHPVRRSIERYARPLQDLAGQRLGWVEVFRDVSSQRMMRSQMAQTEKMAALGQLVSGIAHELSNPLTSIMGYAQLLLSHRATSDRHADALHIYQETERARRIVQNLLLFARQTKPERRPVGLNEVVERTLALRSYELKVENIAVELDLAPGLPRTLADAHQLQQVVLNLVVNAEQAILQARSEEARGHGRIRIRTRAASGSRLRLEVVDDGPGVPPEIASRIFDPFFTTKSMGEGTGLGLAMAYKIVQEHEGEIYLETERPRDFPTGATFVVKLPVLVSELTAVPEPVRAQPEPFGPVAVAACDREMRILVVEDEPTVAQLVTDVLTGEGHRVEPVLDSAEGLKRVLHQHYDLVICDLRMPRLDGRAFYEALVEAGSPAQRRIMFITGDTLARRTFEFLDRHGLPYVAKPFLVEELKRAVHQVLDSARADVHTPEAENGAPRPGGRLPRLVPGGKP